MLFDIVSVACIETTVERKGKQLQSLTDLYMLAFTFKYRLESRPISGQMTRRCILPIFGESTPISDA